jgi:hypothetical protein
MILTIISSLLGILSSTIPSVIKYLERKQEISYELAITNLKIEATIRGVELEQELQKIKTIQGESEDLVEEGSSLRQHDLGLTGGSFIGDLRASVRPVITYAFFGLFLGVKVLVAIVIVSQAGLNINTMQTFSASILDESTIAIFGTILGFWFGSRSLAKNETIIHDKVSTTATAAKKK